MSIFLNRDGWWGHTLDLPGLTQVIWTFQDETNVTTAVGNDDHSVFSWRKIK